DQQTIRRVVQGKRELVHPSLIEFRKTLAKITLDASCRLIALLGRLRKQLHDDSGHRTRNLLRPFVGRDWLSRNMGVHEFHWIGRRKRECPRQHFVQNDAHRVKITPRIDGPIHSPRLLRRHVRERTADELRRRRRLTLTRHTRGHPKTRKPDLITAGIDQNVRWLDVFVNQLTLMHMSECRCKTECDSETTPNFHRSVDKTIERFASTILKDEHPLIVVARQRERLSCPAAV